MDGNRSFGKSFSKHHFLTRTLFFTSWYSKDAKILVSLFRDDKKCFILWLFYQHSNFDVSSLWIIYAWFKPVCVLSCSWFFKAKGVCCIICFKSHDLSLVSWDQFTNDLYLIENSSNCAVHHQNPHTQYTCVHCAVVNLLIWLKIEVGFAQF